MTTVTSNRSVFPARTGKTRRSPFLQSGECDSRTQAPVRRCPLERCLSWTPHDRPKTDFELRAVPCSAGSRAAPAKPMSSHHLAFECGPGRAAGEGTPLHFVSHVTGHAGPCPPPTLRPQEERVGRGRKNAGHPDLASTSQTLERNADHGPHEHQDTGTAQRRAGGVARGCGEKLAAPSRSAEWIAYLRFVAAFRRYSFKQPPAHRRTVPAASRVAGYRPGSSPQGRCTSVRSVSTRAAVAQSRSAWRSGQPTARSAGRS